MKKIRLKISDASAVAASIEELDKQIPNSKKKLPEFNLFHDLVVKCIEDFGSRVKKHSKTGTTIHLEKEFDFSGLSILIILDYPKKESFFGRVKKVFGA
jgi:hypothetical protein